MIVRPYYLKIHILEPQNMGKSLGTQMVASSLLASFHSNGGVMPTTRGEKQASISHSAVNPATYNKDLPGKICPSVQ